MQKSDNLLSYTVASMRLNETIKIAQYAMENGFGNYKQIKDADIVFGGVKSLSFEKTYYQIKKRLETLTSKQMELLVDCDLISQKQLVFLAICKCYTLIKEFTIEVIREKTLVYDYQINETDFNSFIQGKLQDYPKLQTYTISTFNKAKQVMFLILEQAGIIDNINDKRIQPQLLNPSVVKAIADDDRNLLKIFLYSDRDINELKY